MIFKFVSLDVDRGKGESDSYFSTEEGYPFYLKSRSLCDYIERKISRLKLKTEKYNQLSICGFKKKAPVDEYINSSNVLCVYLSFFDFSTYTKIDKNNFELLNEFYIEMLLEGLERAKKYELPEKEIIEAIDEFRKNNYINQWIFKRKRITGKKANCLIECNVNTNFFELDLVVVQSEKEIYRENFIKEDPNAMVNNYHFGDLQVSKEGIITVTDRRKKVLLEFDSNSILS